MYRAYYHLDSKQMFSTVEKSKPVESVAEDLIPLIDDVRTSDDSLFVYCEATKQKVMVSRDSKGELFIEIHSSGGILYRYVDKTVLISLLKDISDLLSRAVDKYGFKEECL